MGIGVERPAEDPGEREHVVDLVREVAAAGGHHGGVLRRDVGGHLGGGVRQGEDDRVVGHPGQMSLVDGAAGDADEGIGTVEGLADPAGDTARVRRRGDGLLRLGQVGAAGFDDALGIEDDDIGDTGVGEDLRHGHACRPCPGDDDPDRVEGLVDHAQRVRQRREDDDGGAVLVIVHDRDVEGFLDAVLDLEAARRRDVFEVDRAEGRGHADDGLDDLVGVVGVEHDRDGIDAGEGLEQGALALHHRQRGGRADVAEAEHGRTIGDDRDEAAGPGVRARHLRFVLDRSADLGHARCVGDREIPLSLQRTRELGGQLATFVRGEDLFIGDRSLRVLVG